MVLDMFLSVFFSFVLLAEVLVFWWTLETADSRVFPGGACFRVLR